jgi:hypothetical protein
MTPAKLTQAFNTALDGRSRRIAVQFGTTVREFGCLVTDPATGPISATGPTPSRAIALARRSWIEARS